MNIALFTDGVWPWVIGGMQKHSYFLCRYLVSQGAKVHLFHTAPDTNTVDLKSVFDGRTLASLTSHLIEYPRSFYFPGHYLFNSYRYSKQVWEEFCKINGVEFDFVYIQGLTGWELLQHKKELPARTKLVLNFHGLEMFQRAASFKSWFEQAMFRPFVRKQLNQADIVQSLGGRLTEIVRQQVNNPDVRILELGIGVEDEWIRNEITSSGSKRNFCFIGRYERRKGIEELMQALSAYSQLDRCLFHFIGPIPEALRFQSEYCIYHGELKSADAIRQVLDQSDFLLVPSYAEGMPTVILEAMARGCAIIATDVGAVTEQVDDQNGILLQAPSKDEIVKALDKALDLSSDELNNMKKHSLAKVSDKFRWSRIVQQLLKSVNGH